MGYDPERRLNTRTYNELLSHSVLTTCRAFFVYLCIVYAEYVSDITETDMIFLVLVYA